MSDCSSPTRGLFGGGNGAENTAGNKNEIEYITISSTGNVTDFGDLTSVKYVMAAGSSHLRGVFAGGISSSELDVIEYVTIATTGDVTDFGNLTVGRYGLTIGNASAAHGGLA